jgi:2-methylisocitrate lyase-like PEP mutase family enzyme
VRSGRTFKGVAQLANMLEGGRTPVLKPVELHRLGFSRVAYPPTLIFRVAHTMEKALSDLKAETLKLDGEGVSFEQFKAITRFSQWQAVEERSAVQENHPRAPKAFGENA